LQCDASYECKEFNEYVYSSEDRHGNFSQETGEGGRYKLSVIVAFISLLGKCYDIGAFRAESRPYGMLELATRKSQIAEKLFAHAAM